MVAKSRIRRLHICGALTLRANKMEGNYNPAWQLPYIIEIRERLESISSRLR